jgi:hypothetical protein
MPMVAMDVPVHRAAPNESAMKPVLQGERVTLRPLTASDAEAIYARWRNQPPGG